MGRIKPGPKIGSKFTEEHKQKLRESLLISMNKPEVLEKISGEKHHAWKGGLRGYLHYKAQELFGSPICQECGIFIGDYKLTHKHKRFQMHCVSKDLTILEQWNWKCVCRKCHSYIHNMEKLNEL